jgi:hypothetical protein
MPALALDWGGYPYAVKLKECRENAGAEIFISQGGGEGTPGLLKTAKELGYVTGEYFWQTALRSVQEQVDDFSRTIDVDQPEFIMVDYEHFWADWVEHNEWVMGKRTIANVRKMPGQKISDSGELTWELLEKRWQPKLQVLYTSAPFVIEYSPQTSKWIGGTPLSVASFPDYGFTRYEVTWEYLKAHNIRQFPKGNTFSVDIGQPSLPPGANDWLLWQYSSRQIVPGEYWPYDYQITSVPIEEFKRMCGLGPVIPPIELTDGEKLARLWAAHPNLH